MTEPVARCFQAAVQRSAKLHDSHNYQLFLKNVNEVSGWIGEKMKIATDESYREPTNLQGKIQKHQAFDAEVSTNKRRMEAVTVVSTNCTCGVFGRDLIGNILWVSSPFYRGLPTSAW